MAVSARYFPDMDEPAMLRLLMKKMTRASGCDVHRDMGQKKSEKDVGRE